MKKWAETVRSNSAKILEEVRKMVAGLETNVGNLREAMSGLESCPKSTQWDGPGSDRLGSFQTEKFLIFWSFLEQSDFRITLI